MTKGLNSWNKKSFNTWGVHAMYSADGFLKSMTASMSSRLKHTTSLLLMVLSLIKPSSAS